MKLLRYVALMLGLLLAACSGSEAVKDDVPGDYYTAANIWYDKPLRIYKNNFHVGMILRAGTKCRVTDVSDDAIEFETADGREYRIVAPRRDHTRMSMQEVFKFYFSGKNEMGPDGKFARFTQTEQEAVRGAVVMKGMRREAVLMAYGYPDRGRTPSLEAYIWVFRHSRFVNRSVRFENGLTTNGIF